MSHYANRGGYSQNIGAYGSYQYYDRWRWPYPNYNARFGLYGYAGPYAGGQYPLGGGFNDSPAIPGYREAQEHYPPHYGYAVRPQRHGARDGIHAARGFYAPNGSAHLNRFRGEGLHAFYPNANGLYYPATWRPAFW